MSSHAEQSDVAQVPKPPSRCGCYGCVREAQILFVLVDDHGRQRCGAALEFTNEDERTHSLTMRGGYEFIRWVPRCDVCYQRDIDTARKGRADYLRGLPDHAP